MLGFPCTPPQPTLLMLGTTGQALAPHHTFSPKAARSALLAVLAALLDTSPAAQLVSRVPRAALGVPFSGTARGFAFTAGVDPLAEAPEAGAAPAAKKKAKAKAAKGPPLPVYKTRADFGSDDEYGRYIKSVLVIGMKVRVVRDPPSHASIGDEPVYDRDDGSLSPSFRFPDGHTGYISTYKLEIVPTAGGPGAPAPAAAAPATVGEQTTLASRTSVADARESYGGVIFNVTAKVRAATVLDIKSNCTPRANPRCPRSCPRC